MISVEIVERNGGGVDAEWDSREWSGVVGRIECQVSFGQERTRFTI
jgi:hypothetical protein